MRRTDTKLWMLMVLAGFAVTAAAGELRVGVGKRVVTPDLKQLGKVYIAGYDNNRVATGVHDDLYARCMAISTGQAPLAICGVDVIGLYWDDVQKMRARIPGAQLVVAATHDHEGPDTMGLWGPSEGKTGMDERYMQFLIEKTVEAAKEAIGDLKPAKVRLARVKTPELDSFIKDNRPPEVHDSEVILLQAVGAGGQPVGTLVNWANHPEALGSSNQLITADYPAKLCSELEKLAGGTVVFVNGAVGGMQSPGNAKIKDRKTGRIYDEASFEKAEYVGGRVAELSAEALKKGEVLAVDEIQYKERLTPVPMANPMFLMAAQAGLFLGRKQANAEGNAEVPVGLIRLSGGGRPVLEAALIPGELYPELSVGGVERYAGADYPDAPVEPAVKQMLKAPYRMLFGLANDENGYIIPKAEWDQKAPWLQNAKEKWYGEVNSVGPETAPKVIEALGRLIH